MAEIDYDLIVIGAGSGGVRASRFAARTGAKVAVVEYNGVGGTCVLRGCIPKKVLVYASHFAEDFLDARAYGWDSPVPGFDWRALIANKDKELARLNGVYLKLLSDAGVTLISGRAKLADRHTVEVNGERLRAGTILIATGSTPIVPEIPGVEHAITSNEAFHLESLPKRVVIFGGGYIAVEFAGIFHGLGSEVTVLIRSGKVLRGFDEDLRDELGKALVAQGIAIHKSEHISRIDKTSAGLSVHTREGDVFAADTVMFAMGRAPNTAGLGLESAGITLANNGAIEVDMYSRTSMRHIFAVGDVTARKMLTPVALAEATAFVETAFKNNPVGIDYRLVPSAVFSQPPLATVGLSEAAARSMYPSVDVYRTRFRPLKHTLTGRNAFTFMKLVVDGESGRVLGCHMLGEDAAEIIQGLAVALTCGATKAQFDATIGIHPTAAEEFVTLREKAPQPAAAAD
jgi:glutathione reductase (NADPH)